MKRFTFFLALLITASLFSQDYKKIEEALDTMNIDFSLTPDKVLKNNLFGKGVVWAGKPEFIDIAKKNDTVEIFFYCNHRDFDTVSRQLISEHGMTIKDHGSGKFAVSIISTSMTREDAERIKALFFRQSDYLLTVGKAVDTLQKAGNNYIYIKSYYFYTFNEHGK